MPLLKNRVLSLRTIARTCVVKNLDKFWKEEWNPELKKITEASDDILINLPSNIRLEILSESLELLTFESLEFEGLEFEGLEFEGLEFERLEFEGLEFEGLKSDLRKVLLLLSDHNSLNGTVKFPFEPLKRHCVADLMARRCVKSTTLDISSYDMADTFRIVLATCTQLTELWLRYEPGNYIDIISDNLHNLEKLFLDDEYDLDSIKRLVTGCPKLKSLHIKRDYRTEPARCLLLGLPNLVELKHPGMVFALEQIIRDGETERVSALRNLYIHGEVTYNFDHADKSTLNVAKATQVVMGHLRNITKIELGGENDICNEALIGLYKSVSKLSCLTHLSLLYYSRNTHIIISIIKAVGHQLKILAFRCEFIPELYHLSDVINQCRELQILCVRIPKNIEDDQSSCYESYGNDLTEEFTPFCYLQALFLDGFVQPYLKPALLKSLIASPQLQELTLVDVSNFTDHVLKAAFNHTNDDGEQLAFTSLRKLSLDSCDFITDCLESVVTNEKVPLESLEVNSCRYLTDIYLWNLDRFQMDVIDKHDYYEDYEDGRDIDCFYDSGGNEID